jgi:flagellin
MISINTNTASSAAAYNLASTSTNLQKSLNRLSSGFRINSSVDDAGGLAVSMKLSAAVRRTDAASANVGNALSFLQTQDGVLKNVDKILNRLSELATLAQDVTKSSSDRILYGTEATALREQINAMVSEEFNGVSLFTTSGSSSLTVRTSEDGSQTVSISQATLGGASGITNTLTAVSTNITTSASSATTAAQSIETAITELATLRAANGSQQVRLTYAADMLSLNKQNLEAANSRIIDVDVAKESAQLARFNILQQAGTAMLAQANQSTQSILRLLV